ncbi:MAG: sensor histidine kinase [Aggregatilineales bacterium]
MSSTEQGTSLTKLIQFAGAFWLVYLITIGIIDRLLVVQPAVFDLMRLYYVPNGLYALCFLGLAYWTWLQRKLSKAFLPILIGLNLALPLATGLQIVPNLPRGPTLMVEGIELRNVPILLVGVILAAYQYRWKYVLLIALSIVALKGGDLLTVVGLGKPQFYPAYLVTIIEAVSLLTIGSVVSRLVSQLRTQQRSLHDANGQLAHYASTLEQLTTSRERNRIARELHDVLAHTLSGLSVQLESVKAYVELEPQTAVAMLEKSLDATRHGLEETRRALKALRASPLDDLGLGLAIVEVAKDTAARGHFALELALPEQLIPLPPNVEQCLYRVAQEALANVLHHANATCVQVKLQQADERVMLTVKDNGLGFDREAEKKPGHFGLTGMYERAQLVGGTLTVVSQPGHGVTLELVI